MSKIEYLKYSIDNFKQFGEVLKILPTEIAFILNEDRRIVFENAKVLNKLDIKPNNIGKRPGEAMYCIYGMNAPDGCGSTNWCRYCGIVNTITQSKKTGLPQDEEVRLMVIDNKNEQRDIEVTSTPIVLGRENYTVFSIKDISDKKRRQLLERTFFHDIINLAGSLDGIIESMEEMDYEETQKFQKIAKRLCGELVDDIMAQDELVKAESNTLKAEIRACRLTELIEHVIESIQFHQVAKGKKIKLSVEQAQDHEIHTDPKLFNRVLINMCKNAIEASSESETVTIRAKQEGTLTQISVHNTSYIPQNIRRQIFHRSFSTKGVGRGIGTYSMKLISEKYLKGNISFTSTKEKGTTFTLAIKI